MTEDNAAAEEAAEAGAAADEGRDQPPADRETGSGGDEETIESLRQQAEDHWSRYLRSVAELENLRKRSAREVESARKYGIERLVAEILPVRDSLEAGLKAARDVDAQTLDIASLLEGEQATLRLLDQALESAGITEIDPEGEPFDPERHEAMSMLPSPTAEPNSVIAVVQKGYALHERIVRPARVVVAQPPPESEQGSGA